MITTSLVEPALERTFRPCKKELTSLAYNPNLKCIAASSVDNNIYVMNFKQGMRTFKFTGHKGKVNQICFSPCGQLVASASADETVKLWHNSVFSLN